MTVQRHLKGSPHFNGTWSLCLIEISNIYKNNTSFPGGPSCSQSFNWLSGQRTHQVSGDRIGQSLSLWQIPGTQRSWMKRCRTPREKEMEERHFMCHIWGLQKSVSSKCQQPVQGENEISCHRSWEALLWLTFNMMLFRSAAQTQCHSHRCHMRNISPSATSGYTTTREAKHARRTTRRDILWPVFFFFIMWKVHVHKRCLVLGNMSRGEDWRGWGGVAVKHWLTGNDLTDILIKEKTLGGPSISPEWQG